MRFNLGRTVLAVISVTVMVSSIFSAPARLLSYQGRLTDGSGQPISGPFRVRFIMYDAPFGGTALWEEQNDVTVGSDGLFTILLGSTTQLPSDLFDGSERYLGIRVQGDAELTPRSMLTTVPTAFYSTNAQDAQTAQSAGTASSAPNYLPLSGGTMTGTTFHNGVTSQWQSGGIDRVLVNPNVASIQMNGSDGWWRAQLHEWFGVGVLNLLDSSPYTQGEATLAARGIYGGSGGMLVLIDSAGAFNTLLDASLTGNSSVMLPDSAIDSWEILNEPGIAASQLSGTPSYFPCTGVPVDLLTLSITIPSSGYIVLDARCLLIGTVGLAQAYVQIDETSGGSQLEFATTLQFGLQGNDLRVPVSTYRIYFKPAGTHTFRLEGSGTCSVTLADNPMMKATYYPTSYGSVVTMVSSSEASQFENAEAVSVPSGPDGKGPATTMYQVDLRELELKAAKLRAETEKAERELAEAKMAEMRKQQVQDVSDKQ